MKKKNDHPKRFFLAFKTTNLTLAVATALAMDVLYCYADDLAMVKV